MKGECIMMQVAYWVGVIACLSLVSTFFACLLAAVATATIKAARDEKEPLSDREALRSAFKGLWAPARFAWKRKVALVTAGAVAAAMQALAVSLIPTIGFAFIAFLVVGVLVPALQAAIRPTASKAATATPWVRVEPFVVFEEDSRSK